MNVAVRRDAASARELFDLVLRAGRPIAPEYPLLFGAHADDREHGFVTIESEGRVVSACALLRRTLIVRQQRLPVGLIGSVATLPEHRGRGFAARALAAAEDELREGGALLAILWADHPTFYGKRGWLPFGGENDFVLPATVARHLPTEGGIRPRTPADDVAIHALYETHPERVERSLAETSALLACPDMEVLVSERWQRILGYACLGRGADLAQAVHEWAGDAQTVLALARALIERRAAAGDERDLVLMAPLSANDLAARLGELGVAPIPGILGMAKILAPRACAELAARRLDRRGELDVRDDPSANGTLRLCNAKAQVACTDADLLEILFAARGDRTRAETVATTLGLPKDRLPFEPFVWGLDSI